MKNTLFWRLFCALVGTLIMTVLVLSFTMVALMRAERQRSYEAEVMVQAEVLQYAGVAEAEKMQVSFAFDRLQTVPMFIKLDVGASAYWSEIASMQTLDNLLKLGHIDIVDYLERIPDGYVAKRQELLSKYKLRMEQQADAMTAGTETAPAVGVPTEKQ